MVGGVVKRAFWTWVHGGLSGLQWKPKVRKQNRFLFCNILLAFRVVARWYCFWKVLFVWMWSFLCLRWVIRRDLRFFVLVCIRLEEGCDILILICFEEEESNVLAEVEVSILGGFGIVFWRIWRFWYF